MGTPTGDARHGAEAAAAIEAPDGRRGLRARAVRVALPLAILALLFAFDARILGGVVALRDVVDARLGGPTPRHVRDFWQFPAHATFGFLLFGAIAALDRRRARALLFAAVVLSVGLAGSATKHVFGRARPPIAMEQTGRFATRFGGPAEAFGDSHDQSFPSGHAAAVGANAVALSAFYPAWAPLFWGVAVASSVERVYHLKHFPSDVFAGLWLAAVVGGAVLRSGRITGACERFANALGAAIARRRAARDAPAGPQAG